ncbi:MAG: CYTH domain-containing protein [Lysobacterales bacterium]|jgi:adenylate cyclase|nr:MAG: CYTH domain-containing protein [Xanthomonadales bacterium]
MGIEIERKFIVRGEGWRPLVRESRLLVQGYLARTPVAVRVRRIGEQALLSLKEATPAILRREFEYEIPLADAEALFALCLDPPLRKRRHWVPYGGATFEIDEFLDQNEGLVIAEIELPAVSAEFPRPPWLGREVSEDSRFFNVELARRPFSQWSLEERAACC